MRSFKRNSLIAILLGVSFALQAFPSSDDIVGKVGNTISEGKDAVVNKVKGTFNKIKNKFNDESENDDIKAVKDAEKAAKKAEKEKKKAKEEQEKEKKKNEKYKKKSYFKVESDANSDIFRTDADGFEGSNGLGSYKYFAFGCKLELNSKTKSFNKKYFIYFSYPYDYIIQQGTEVLIRTGNNKVHKGVTTEKRYGKGLFYLENQAIEDILNYGIIKIRENNKDLNVDEKHFKKFNKKVRDHILTIKDLIKSHEQYWNIYHPSANEF